MIRLDTQETIAAVASPPGPGSRGLVRLSGLKAWSIALDGFDNDGIFKVPTHRPGVVRGRLRVDLLRRSLAATIALWPEPRTYTGQPLAEIHTVGSPPVVQQVLSHCLSRGARLAEPGEFTLRAFLAGRLDLSQAEAVLGVIEAESSPQLDAALRQLAGGLSGPIERVRDRVLDVLAHLEAGLDFVDEPDVDPIGRQALASTLAVVAVEVSALAERLRSRDRPEGHPRVVLVGPPNAGKSRLFNALVGQDHAIVSSVAGTTRDYLSSICDCEGLLVELIDTAGIDATIDPIEAQAQSLRAARAAEADLLLHCRSSQATVGAKLASDRPILRVWTKADLANANDVLKDDLVTSAATGLGLTTLRARIASTLRARTADGDAPSATSARCRDSLARSALALQSASATLSLGGSDELVAIDLRSTLDELGKVVGAVVTDDILDRIFSRFCIGK